jgi:hypothetical protein
MERPVALLPGVFFLPRRNREQKSNKFSYLMWH